MVHYYLRLGEEDIIEGLATSPKQSDSPYYVEITQEEYSKGHEFYYYKKYDRRTGEISEDRYEPESTAPLTEFLQLKKTVEELEQQNADLAFMLMESQGGGQ